MQSKADFANSAIQLNTFLNRPAGAEVKVADSLAVRFEFLSFTLARTLRPENEVLEMLERFALVFDPALQAKRHDVGVARHFLESREGGRPPFA